MPTNVVFRLPNFISLNGVDLTDESRQPIQENRDERAVRIDLASGKIRKFIKGEKRKWTIQWANLPIDASYTIDGYSARNEIRNIVYQNGPFPFVIHDGLNAAEYYTVFISDYQESNVTRSVAGITYSVQLSLEEQG